MGIYLFIGIALLAGAAVPFLLPPLRKSTPQLHSAFMWLFVIMPVCIGGFYTWLSIPVSGLLFYYLFLYARREKHLNFYFNLSSAAVLAVYLGFCLTPLWAADKGMAVFSIIRYLPLVLYMLLLMQMSADERRCAFSLIPLSGAGMALLSFVLQFIPALTEHFTVNGRLSGFFQYPNTFALFLLIGFYIQGTKEKRSLWDIGIDFVLISGIVLSGSRAVFVLLIAAALLLVICRRSVKFTLLVIALLVLSLSASFLLSHLETLNNSDRFTAISLTSSTFLGRLLYYKDALRVIIRNPFGLGYWGYQALEGSFQTGSYSVAFVHNGLLQLMLDIGWIPSLLLAAAFIKTLWTKKTPLQIKGLLLITLAHCMFDFDILYV